MTRAPGGYLAFLDLTSCGFGCALILMLVVASVNTPPRGDQPRQRVLFVRFAGTAADRPEIAVECLRPREREADRVWERVDRMTFDDRTQSALPFFAPSATGSGAEAIAVIYNPAPGEWAFRAYLVGFPKGAKNVGARDVVLSLRAEYDGEVPIRADQKPLRWPGDATDPVRLDVPPAP